MSCNLSQRIDGGEVLIKSKDGQSTSIQQLEQLLTVLVGSQRKRVEEELRILRAGEKTEKQAAYLINFDYLKSKSSAIIHDLRLDVGGRVAQIDHLVMDRLMNVFVIETKSFYSGVKINDQGEFLRWNSWKKSFEGMPSPLAQNDRHISVLNEAFELFDMPHRLGMRLKPMFHSVILVDSKARIDRPKYFDTSHIIKSDMLREHIDKVFEESNSLVQLSKVVFPETLEKIARNLANLHRPFSVDYCAKFGITEPTLQKADTKTNTDSSEDQISVQQRHACRKCGDDALSIKHGKYGYYFKCKKCDGNTPIKVDCDVIGHHARIRKDKHRFFKECDQCGSSTLFYENT